MENRNNNPIAEEIIHNNPTGYGLFAGIGDNFNSAAQAICELADDAISNLRANSDDPDLSMTIVVSFENLGDAVEIGVVDGGTRSKVYRHGHHQFGQCADHRLSGRGADAAERAWLRAETRAGVLRQQPQPAVEHPDADEKGRGCKPVPRGYGALLHGHF